MSDLKNIVAIEAWDAFWSIDGACAIFESDGSSEQEVYYCLGELAVILCRDEATRKNLIDAYNKMNAIQKAAFLDASNPCDVSSMRIDFWCELHSKQTSSILNAAILRVLLALCRSEIANLCKEVKNQNESLIRGRFADELSKLKNLIDSEFDDLKDNCILE